MHANGKIVAVWIETNQDQYTEDEEFYKQIYDLKVDMLTTDHPLQAHKALQRYHEQKRGASC